jgi:DNA-damage-inducible protein J
MKIKNRGAIMAQVSIRIDDNIKEQTDAILTDLGLNMSTAFNMFARQIIKQRGIPFPITMGADSSMANESREEIRARAILALQQAGQQSVTNGTDKMTMEEGENCPGTEVDGRRTALEDV